MIGRREILSGGVVATGALMLAPYASGASGSGSGFTHDVASGDPKQADVTLWTRYKPANGEDTELRVVIADDKEMKKVRARDRVTARAANDWCVSPRVSGLEPGRWYYYQFSAPNGLTSPTGRTRTLPAGPTDSFRVAVVSCNNATSGWFNAFAEIATRDNMDLVVHLGDYIYESRLDRNDAVPGLAELRGLAPFHEVVTLADYRARYASYRADPAFQALHRNFPMIVMMDDHESANNSWAGGAKNHDAATEGAWAARRRSALKAFHEWVPGTSALYDRFDIGDLASLFRLETRLLARSEWIDLAAVVQDMQPTDIFKSITGVRAALSDPDRTMLGREQETWLADNLRRSVTDGVRWQVIAQGVIMGKRRFPTAANDWFSSGGLIPVNGNSASELERSGRLLEILTRLDLPYATDTWDGYPAARSRLYESLRESQAEAIILSGDSHNAWAFDLFHEGERLAVEMSTMSVSSFGFDKAISGNLPRAEHDFANENAELVWCDLSRRGYLDLELRQQSAIGEWRFIPSRRLGTPLLESTQRFVVEHGLRQLMPG